MNKTSHNDPNLVAESAVAYLQRGEHAQAEKILLSGIERHPDHCVLRHNLAELYRNLARDAQALELFSAIIEKHPHFFPSYHSLILLLKKQLSSGNIALENRIAFVQKLAQYINNMGNVLLDNGQVEAARDAYREAMTLWPDYSAALSNLSNVLNKMGQTSEAESLAGRAVKLNPQFAQAWNNLGNALSSQNRFKAAAACFERALAINPTMAEVRHNAGSGSLFLQIFREDITMA